MPKFINFEYYLKTFSLNRNANNSKLSFLHHVKTYQMNKNIEVKNIILPASAFYSLYSGFLFYFLALISSQPTSSLVLFWSLLLHLSKIIFISDTSPSCQVYSNVGQFSSNSLTLKIVYCNLIPFPGEFLSSVHVTFLLVLNSFGFVRKSVSNFVRFHGNCLLYSLSWLDPWIISIG